MSAPEPDFEKLQKLLVCKRYEQPPPGYFYGFSERVVSRLVAEDAQVAGSWWEWLARKIDPKLVVVCAYGAAVSSLLLAGFRLSQVSEPEPDGIHLLRSPWLGTTPTSSGLFPMELRWNSSISPYTGSSSAVFGLPAAETYFPHTDRFGGQTISFGAVGR